MTTLYDVEGFNVVHSTLYDELNNVRPEYRVKLITKLVALFGCYSVILDQSHINQMASMQVKPTTMIKPGAYIVVLEDFIKTLNEKEKEAIVFHEVGHLVSNHLVDIGPDTLLVHETVLVSTKAELEADQYAAARVGKSAMRSALEKIIANGADIVEKFASIKGKPFDKGAFLATVYAEDQFQARLAALS